MQGMYGGDMIIRRDNSVIMVKYYVWFMAQMINNGLKLYIQNGRNSCKKELRGVRTADHCSEAHELFFTIRGSMFHKTIMNKFNYAAELEKSNPIHFSDASQLTFSM